MWLNLAAKLVPGMIKTGMSIASNRRKTKELESVAELKLAERMANGEVEYKKAVIDSHKGDLKDEFCLILISIPLLLLAWSVFSDDPNIQAKIDIFFDKFANLPMFYQALVVGAFSTILGIKGVSTFKKKQMSDNSLDIINEYKDQVRILKQQISELEDAGKSKDAANKRCLQKLEHLTKDLEDANAKIQKLEDTKDEK